MSYRAQRPPSVPFALSTKRIALLARWQPLNAGAGRWGQNGFPFLVDRSTRRFETSASGRSYSLILCRRLNPVAGSDSRLGCRDPRPSVVGHALVERELALEVRLVGVPERDAVLQDHPLE